MELRVCDDKSHVSYEKATHNISTVNYNNHPISQDLCTVHFTEKIKSLLVVNGMNSNSSYTLTRIINP